MGRFVARRLAHALAIVVLVATIAFVLVHLAPGDPFSASLENSSVPESVRRQWRALYGLDRPLPEQYVRWMANVLRGDFGWSHARNRPVADVLAAALPNTLLLMLVALTVGVVLGVTLGVVQALRRGGALDRLLGAASMAFYSMPDFWLAVMAIVFVAHWVPALPTSGMTTPVIYAYMDPVGRALDVLRHLVLPAVVLVLLTAAGIARYQRAALIDVVRQDFTRTARAKGLTERAVVMRHALRNALLPVITLIGLAIPALLTGTVFVERVFAWPGVGALALDAIFQRDYHLVMAIVVIGGALVAVGSLVADLLYAAADPRLRTA